MTEGVHVTVDATIEAARSADGTPIRFERAGTRPRLILVDAALGFRGFGPVGPLAAELAPGFTVITYDCGGRGENMDTPTRTPTHRRRRRAPADPRLALLEHPLALDEPDESDLGAEVAELVAAGRRGDAVEHFNKSIGVPEEMLAGMRDARRREDVT